MAKGKFVRNDKGVAKALKSQAMRDDIMARAQRIAAAAGDGFEASVVVGRNRIHGSVISRTRKAARAEEKRRALSRATDAGRG